MIVTAVQCKLCKDIIFSRARHDFRECSCGKTFVDGGFEYLRYGGEAEEEVKKVEVATTKQELYDDWNLLRDKFGLIKGE